MVRVGFAILPNGMGLPPPSRQTDGAAGIDLHAALAGPIELPPGGRALVPCGFALALPPGYEAQIRPRSGLAVRHGVTVLNSPGTVDADYRGEIGVVLINHGEEPFLVRRGDRIAQMVVAPVITPFFVEEKLDDTARGQKGFGSTGS